MTIVFISAQRLFAIPVPFILYIVLCVGIFIVAVVMTLLRRPTLDLAAIRLDTALNIKNRIASALFATKIPEDRLAQTVIRDATENIRNIKLRHALPVRLGRSWAYMPLAIGLAAAAHFLLPQLDLAGLAHAREQRDQEQADAQLAQDQLAKTVAAIDQVTADQPDRNPTDPDELDQQRLLEQLAQLTPQDLSDPEKRRSAAQKLSEANEQLAELALEQEKSLRPLENALTRLDPGKTGPADAFTNALRRGDFDTAQEAIQDLTSKIESMPESDRQALADQLQNLSEQLENEADQQQQLADQASQQAADALQDAGLTQEQVDQLKQLANNPQALEQQLQQQGISQQDAQNLARQLSEAQRDCQSANQSGESCQGLSQALKQMQQSARNQQGQGKQGQGQSFQNATDGAADQLSEIAKMREQLSQLQRAQSQTQKSLDQLSQGSGGKQSDGSKDNQQALQELDGGAAGVGGQQAGTGEGGNPLGQHKNPGQYNVNAADDIRQGDGRIITSWLDQSPSPAGEPTVEYNQAVTEARQHAEKAVTEDRVPHRYHQAIRQYFDQIPESTDQIQSPPPAPN